MYSSSDAVACHLTHTVPCAHQKPITALKAAAGRLVTGSQDHTLRVSVGTISWALGWPSTGGGEHMGSAREWLEVSWMNCGREFLSEVCLESIQHFYESSSRQDDSEPGAKNH